MTPDPELLRRWRAGDREAGNELLTRHFGSVRRFFASKVAGADVEDLVQRTFAGCVEAAERFRGDARFSTFLFSIARRQLYRHFRDSARDGARTEPDLSLSSVLELGQSPSSIVAGAEMEALLLQALQRVPVDQQTMLELHYWEDLSAAEIAEVLEIQPGNVRTRLHRARAALRSALQELVGHESDQEDVDEVARVLGRKV